MRTIKIENPSKPGTPMEVSRATFRDMNSNGKSVRRWVDDVKAKPTPEPTPDIDPPADPEPSDQPELLPDNSPADPGGAVDDGIKITPAKKRRK